MFNFLVLFTLAGNTFAGLGPVTDLRINNADVSPDGVPRPAVLAENSVDRTIVNGYKVLKILCTHYCTDLFLRTILSR